MSADPHRGHRKLLGEARASEPICGHSTRPENYVQLTRAVSVRCRRLNFPVADRLHDSLTSHSSRILKRLAYGTKVPETARLGFVGYIKKGPRANFSLAHRAFASRTIRIIRPA
jgi:hypothetical protein